MVGQEIMTKRRSETARLRTNALESFRRAGVPMIVVTINRGPIDATWYIIFPLVIFNLYFFSFF